MTWFIEWTVLRLLQHNQLELKAQKAFVILKGTLGVHTYIPVSPDRR
jgi:hypothetical protein